MGKRLGHSEQQPGPNIEVFLFVVRVLFFLEMSWDLGQKISNLYYLQNLRQTTFLNFHEMYCFAES